MNVTPEAFREVCYRCRRAKAVCLCPVLSTIPTKAKIVFLQHPREARNPIGTVRMAHLQLEGSRIVEGTEFANHAEVQSLLEQDRGHAVVLFPAEGARDASELRTHAGPLAIFVLDGTWSQARKLWKQNTFLHALPAYTLSPKEPGRYRIRREPAPHCLSTIEAVGQLLDAIEGTEGAHAALLNPFDAMIEKQISFTGAGVGRVRRRIRDRKRYFAFPEGLDPARAVLVHAEGTGHAARAEGGDNELLEWHAFKPSSGERFYAALQTEKPLNPLVRERLALPEERLPRAALDAAWAAFVGDAPCVGWGRYAPSLYAASGPALANFFDLRTLLTDFLKVRLGYVEDGTERLKLSASDDPRRGHRRVRHLEALFAHAMTLAAARGGVKPLLP